MRNATPNNSFGLVSFRPPSIAAAARAERGWPFSVTVGTATPAAKTFPHQGCASRSTAVAKRGAMTICGGVKGAGCCCSSHLQTVGVITIGSFPARSTHSSGRILAAAPVRRNAQLRQSAGSPHSAPPAVPPWATTHVAPGSCSPRQPPPLGSSPRGPSRNHPHRVSRPCAVLQPYTSLPGYSRFQFRCSGGGGGCLSCGPGSLRLGGNGGGGGSHSRGPRVVCRAGVLEGFSGVSNLMAPEFATVFSAIIAITSVSINLYGGLLTEKRRAELAREVERERQVMAAQDEERSVVARYRGPLLEATVDLEARLYHIATLTGEWRRGDVVCEEEVVYTLFTLAQWLGFLEVIRREGPREKAFLHQGGGGRPGGTDTLTSLVEGFRFVLSAHPATLRKWYEQGDEREHPGCRSRAMMLRGTPALPDDWSDMSYGGDVLERERPPPPPPSAWPRSVAVAAGPRGGGGGGFTVSYGRGPPGPVAGPPPWSVGEPYGAVPPPTKPVLLPNRTDTAAVARSGGSWPAAGPAAGSELVIGSLDEDDLAAAGLGLPDLDIGKLELELDEQSPAGRDSSGGVGGGSAVATTSTALPLGGSAWDASASSAAAASLYVVGGLGSFTTLSSLSSLSSFDEGSLPVPVPVVSGNGSGGGGAAGRRSAPRDVFHVSRGAQRSIGSMMVVTPMGASRHYTLSYGDFYNRYYLDDFFSSWLRPVHTDILALVGGRVWGGQGPFPLNRWTRLLLLQQLLVETIELLDPAHVRVPANRRVVLAPVPYKQAPELEAYRSRMREMSQLDSPLLVHHLQSAQGNGTMGRVREWMRAINEAAAAITAGAPQQQQQQPAAGGPTATTTATTATTATAAAAATAASAGALGAGPAATAATTAAATSRPAAAAGGGGGANGRPTSPGYEQWQQSPPPGAADQQQQQPKGEEEGAVLGSGARVRGSPRH